MNYFDLHCDTPLKCYKEKLFPDSEKLSVYFSAAKKFDNWYQTFAIWINDDTPEPFILYKKMLEDFKSKLKSKPDNLNPILAVEGGAMLENDIERTLILKEDNIKFLTLTWNGENSIAGGSQTDQELTEFGKRVIKRLNNYKIACDLSHINEKSFYPAIQLSDYPLATHSNCYSLCNHPRNLKDEQIKLIAEKGGIIGLNFYPAFLCGDVYEAIYQNIFYLADKGYENNIAIGSDFDGADMNEKLDNISKVSDLYHFLYEKKLDKKLLGKIFFENAQNFVAKL